MIKKNKVLELTKRKASLSDEENIQIQKLLIEVSKFFHYKKQFAMKSHILAVNNQNLSEFSKTEYGFFQVNDYLIAISKKFISHYHSALFGGSNETTDSFEGYPKSILLSISNTIDELKTYLELDSIHFFEFPELELHNNLNFLRISIEIHSNESKYYGFIFKR
jgi:hypothetical protein